MSTGAVSISLILRAALIVATLHALPASAQEQLDGMLRAAAEAQQQGQHRRAIDLLTGALAEAEERGEPEALATVLGSLGSVYLLAGQMDQAKAALQRSLELARRHELASVEAATLTNLGNLLATEARPGDALAAYDAGITRARAIGRRDLLVRALLNNARIALRSGDLAQAEVNLREAGRTLDTPTGPDHAFDLLALARLLLDLPPTMERRRQAFEALQRAATLAGAAGDDRLLSYAMGYMAQLYREQERNDEALALSRRAAWLAEQAGAADPLYAWQRQIGQLLAARGQTTEAIDTYRDAVRTLQGIRLDLPTFDPRTGRSLFREVVGPVFLELTELLLKQAGQVDRAAAQDYLNEARLSIETTKAVELADYFQDDCVAQLQARLRPIDRLQEKTAALYPILLQDRTELLLTLPDGTIRRATTPLSADALAGEAHAFREALETRSNRRFLVQAQALYHQLLRPFEGDLARHQVDTLVFVPDGALRTIPLAALHDGTGFIVARYAVATAPGLTLLDPRPLQRARPRFLLAGLTKSVQGFPPLPHVGSELREIASGAPGTVLLDEAFVVPRVQRSLEDAAYSVVHIASHGEFASDPKNSFLLTFDGRLGVDRLEQLIKPSLFGDEPVELLTLSACRTAAGDDRAALGLAGLAVKAGARSAMASLWFINDEAAAALVAAFYDALGAAGASKAKALQTAQLALMQDRRYRHPAYWAPFLIIGNWL